MTSSIIRSMGYDVGAKTLAVEHHDGSVYHYAGVPAKHWDGLNDASSVGGYMHEHIRGTFDHKRIE